MYSCYKVECDHLEFPSLKKLLCHIRARHLHEPNFTVTCGLNGCQRSFRVWSSFTSHLSRKHKDVDLHEEANAVEADEDENYDVCMDSDIDDDTWNRDDEDINGYQDRHEQAKRTLALYKLKMTEVHRLSQIAMNSLLDETTHLVESSINHWKRQVKGCLNQAGIGVNDVDGLCDIMEEKPAITQVASEFSNPKSEKTYLLENLSLVEPEEVVLGEEIVHAFRKGRRILKTRKDTFQYIPLIKVLERMLNQHDVFTQVQNSHKSNDNKLRDFCDGEYFSRHPLFSVVAHALQLFLYYDDFEVCNPLGSKTKKHKISAFYFLLGNLEPKYRSTLRGIQLVSLCPTRHLTKYGINRILQRFMADVHMLEMRGGVQVEIANHPTFISGTIAQCQADNLASHALGGFMESFRANRPCRFCMGKLEDFQIRFVEEEYQPRTLAGHNHQLQQIERDRDLRTAFGISRPSILNTSEYFHVVGGLSADVMHDILEGTLPLHIKCLLKALVAEEKLFTIEDLNKAMDRFHFGDSDASNKPTHIQTGIVNSSDSSMKQSASQTWCLGRLLPLIIGNMVPEDNRHWQLYLDLLQIVDIIFAPVTSRGLLAYLKVLIADYLKDFKELYPNRPLIPKQHFMVHYPKLTQMLGPLVRHWCMRFEAKNGYFKRLTSGMFNFKNVCKSLAERHQKLQCYHMSSDGALLNSAQFLGSGDTLHLEDLADDVVRLLQTNYGPLLDNSILSRPKQVELYGTVYKAGAIVVKSHDGIMPVFARILTILVLPGSRIVFICNNCVTQRFVPHLGAFEINIMNNNCVLSYESFYDYHPLDLYIIPYQGVRKFVRPRYWIHE